jgi:hypothetical protein
LREWYESNLRFVEWASLAEEEVGDMGAGLAERRGTEIRAMASRLRMYVLSESERRERATGMSMGAGDLDLDLEREEKSLPAVRKSLLVLDWVEGEEGLSWLLRPEEELDEEVVVRSMLCRMST